MKFRLGFVSNSSSSDYVVYTYRCSVCDWEGDTDSGEYSIGFTKCINGHLICKNCLDIQKWLKQQSKLRLSNIFIEEVLPRWGEIYSYLKDNPPTWQQWSEEWIHRLIPPSICPVCKNQKKQEELNIESQKKIINRSIQCIRFLEELEYED